MSARNDVAESRPGRRLALPALVAGLGLMLVACERPVGDFGRAEPSVLHDRLMPDLGNTLAYSDRGELVSDFNKTDEEKTLRDRAWRLVQPPHLNDWFGSTLVEYQRTRILPELDSKFNIKAYYELLRRDEFRSSETRWQRLLRDMQADQELIGPFWKQARRVRQDDSARMHTMDGRPDLTPGELHNATARVEENARVVDWVWRSMRFRLLSYRNCIERMLVETPTRRQWEINQAWDHLQTAIALAEQDTGDLRFARIDTAVRPSRYLSQESIKEDVPQK